MKNIFYILLLAFAISCSPENDLETSTSSVVNSDYFQKRALIQISLSEHRQLLHKNSFLLAKLMSLSATDEQFIRNSLDPATSSVKMSTLFQNNQFKLNFGYVNENYFFPFHTFNQCGNPDTSLWPPSFPRKNLTTSTQNLINDLIVNETEVYIPNDYSSLDPIYIIGHPMIDVTDYHGYHMLRQPYDYVYRGAPCSKWGSLVNIRNQLVANGDFIVLSRPSLATRTYSYINFDITKFLNHTIGTGNGNNNFGGR